MTGLSTFHTLMSIDRIRRGTIVRCVSFQNWLLTKRVHILDQLSGIQAVNKWLTADYSDLDYGFAGRLRPAKNSRGKTTAAGSAHQGTLRRSSSAKMSTAEMVTNEVPSQKMTSSSSSDPKK